MPESPSDIDYTVDIGRHETMFRANTPKGEEFLGGVDLTMSNEEAHTFIQDARAAGLTVKSRLNFSMRCAAAPARSKIARAEPARPWRGGA